MIGTLRSQAVYDGKRRIVLLDGRRIRGAVLYRATCFDAVIRTRQGTFRNRHPSWEHTLVCPPGTMLERWTPPTAVVSPRVIGLAAVRTLPIGWSDDRTVHVQPLYMIAKPRGTSFYLFRTCGVDWEFNTAAAQAQGLDVRPLEPEVPAFDWETQRALITTRNEVRRARKAKASAGPWRTGEPQFSCTIDHQRGPGGHGQPDCVYTFHGWFEMPAGLPLAISQDYPYTASDTAVGGYRQRPVVATGEPSGGVLRPEDAAFIIGARNDDVEGDVDVLLAHIAHLEAQLADLKRERMQEGLDTLAALGQAMGDYD